MKESSEQSPNMVISPPFPIQDCFDSYLVISASEIDLVIPNIFEIHGRNKLYVALIIACDGEVNKELRLLLVFLVPFTSQCRRVFFGHKDFSTYEGYSDYVENEAVKRATRFYPP